MVKECKIYQNKGSKHLELTNTKYSSMSKQYLGFQRTGWMDMDLRVVIF